MEWQVILAVVLVIPIILFPLVFVWYLNIGGVYVAIKERRLKAFEPFVRVIRIGLLVIVPVACYAIAIWLSLSHLGWQVALAVGLILPIVLFVPVLVWVAIASGLYQVAVDRLRHRAIASRRTAVRRAAEPVPERVAYQ